MLQDEIIQDRIPLPGVRTPHKRLLECMQMCSVCPRNAHGLQMFAGEKPQPLDVNDAGSVTETVRHYQ